MLIPTHPLILLSFIFKQGYENTCVVFVSGILSACVLHSNLCACSVQLSIFYMEKGSRNKISSSSSSSISIIIVMITVVVVIIFITKLWVVIIKYYYCYYYYYHYYYY